MRIATQRTIRFAQALIFVSVAATIGLAQTNTFPSSGNVGVGTTSPTSKVQVVVASSGDGVRLEGSQTGPKDPGFGLYDGSTARGFLGLAEGNGNFSTSAAIGDIVLRADTGKLLLQSGSGPAAVAISNGNVGIGTTSPGQKLNVIGNGLFGNLTSRTLLYSGFDSQQNQLLEVGYETAHSAITPFPALVLSNNTTSTSNAEGIIGQIAFANRSIADNNDKRTAVITSWVDGASNSGTLQFYTLNAGTLNERFRITSGGNVGVGTAAPGYKLDVEGGQINASGGLCIAGDCKATWSQVGGGGGSQWTNSGSNIYYNTGSVGIGTSSPSTKLEVSAGDSSFALFGPNTTWGGSLAVGSGAAFVSPISGRAQVLSSNGNLHLDAGTGQNVYLSWLTPTNTIINGQAGNVGIGQTNPNYKLDVNGTAHVSGNLTVDGNLAAKYQDVAEWVPSSERLASGTVVVLDQAKSNQVTASTTAYDTRVAGVVSEQPGVTLGEKSDSKVLVATTGRVRVKVDASRAPIHIGDLLVTSDIPGVAMKSEAVNIGGVQIHRPGTIIGKALEPLEKGSAEILVLLSLQ